MSRRIASAVTAVLAVLALLALSSAASAAVGTDSSALRGAVGSKGMMKHLGELQRIADANDGNRASGTPGYDASAAYVAGKLRAAGYEVTEQPFQFPFFQELAPTTFSRTDVDPDKAYADGTDFAIMEYSGSGNVVDTAVVPTSDVIVPPAADANTSNSGCEASDFPAAVSGKVALIQRGTCTFEQKARNAQAAGAAAAVIFNEGQPGRQDVINGTLGQPGVTIPVIGTTFAVGEELYRAAAARVSLSTTTRSETRSTKNVLADLPGGRTDRTVVVGAHLDSVPEGPGINDNGTGTAGTLEIALQMSRLGIQPRNHVRFAFWGAEESGLLGSEHYVSQLTAGQRKDIAVNLNFDMIGSPNFVRFVYDGDGSDTGASGPNGSGTVERVFLDHFASQGLAVEPTAFDGRSDYGPFIDAGIPAGGLFSGAEDAKTEREAAIYGGTAGLAYDPCYHAACDTVANVNRTSLDQLGDGAAHATLEFAQTGSAVNGTDRASNTAKSKMEFKGPRAER